MTLPKLTPEQEKRMGEVREKWLQRFFSLEFNEENQKKNIQFIYDQMKIPCPPIEFCDSPYMCQIRANELKLERKIDPNDKSQKLEYFHFSYYGDVSDYRWLAYGEFCQELGIVKHEKFDEYKHLCWDANMFLWIPFREVVLVSKPPLFIKKDDRKRLHAEDGPAIKFPDNRGLYYVHGCKFRKADYLKFFPTHGTPEEVLALENTEQRTAIINTYGIRTFLEHPAFEAKELDKQRTYSKVTHKYFVDRLFSFKINGRDYKGLLLTDSTDHSKEYIELVPREMKTVIEAKTWQNHDVKPTDFVYES